MPSRIKTVRSDSAGYNHKVVDHCFENYLYFTITADHDTAVMENINKIGKNTWERGKNEDGSDADYDVAETVHTMNESKNAFRLVIKWNDRGKQSDLFEGNYHYWIIATNIPKQEKKANAIIHFHEQRGEMERMIGELRSHYNMDHFPCGQFSASSLYFAIGLFAYKLVLLLKQHYFGNDRRGKTLQTLRRYWLYLPSRIVFHARYTVAKIATTIETFNRVNQVYPSLTRAPAPA